MKILREAADRLLIEYDINASIEQLLMCYMQGDTSEEVCEEFMKDYEKQTIEWSRHQEIMDILFDHIEEQKGEKNEKTGNKKRDFDEFV